MLPRGTERRSRPSLRWLPVVTQAPPAGRVRGGVATRDQCCACASTLDAPAGTMSYLRSSGTPERRRRERSVDLPLTAATGGPWPRLNEAVSRRGGNQDWRLRQCRTCTMWLLSARSCDHQGGEVMVTWSGVHTKRLWPVASGGFSAWSAG